MRREDFKQQGGGDAYIDWLKSKGCRFYAPMDYENGTNELIQGWTFSVRSGCTCEWDSNEHAYKITGNSSSYASAMWNGKSIQPQNVGSRAVTTKFTLVCDFNITSSVTWGEGYIYGGSDDFGISSSGTSSSRNVLTYLSREFYTRNGRQCMDNTWYTYMSFRDNGYIKLCGVDSQGLDIMESSTDTSWAFVYNQNCDTHVSIGAGLYGYFRNLYIFDTMLSDSDAMTVYNHDHQ